MASLLRENHIITSGDTIRVSQLKTDPYAFALSFGQFTKITYTLARDAVVTVKLVAPSGTALTLINNEYQAQGPHETEWRGLDTNDMFGKKLLVTEEGDYTVLVQTVNPETGTSALTKGYLNLSY